MDVDVFDVDVFDVDVFDVDVFDVDVFDEDVLDEGLDSPKEEMAVRSHRGQNATPLPMEAPPPS